MSDMARAGAVAAALILASATVAATMHYPFGGWILPGALAAYCVMLWHRPVMFLLVIPIVLPAWDLGIWTGWTMIAESDLFVAATLAVLLIRTVRPGAARDSTGQVGLATAAVLGAFALCWLIPMLTGLFSSFGAPIPTTPCCARQRASHRQKPDGGSGPAAIHMPAATHPS